MQYTRIKQLREDNDYTQKYIANELKMKQPQYARYESGKREFPIDNIITLSRLYKTSIDYMLGETDEKKPYPRIKKQ